MFYTLYSAAASGISIVMCSIVYFLFAACRALFLLDILRSDYTILDTFSCVSSTEITAIATAFTAVEDSKQQQAGRHSDSLH